MSTCLCGNTAWSPSTLPQLVSWTHRHQVTFGHIDTRSRHGSGCQCHCWHHSHVTWHHPRSLGSCTLLYNKGILNVYKYKTDITNSRVTLRLKTTNREVKMTNFRENITMQMRCRPWWQQRC